MKKNRIERIKYMEAILDELTAAVDQLSAAVAAYRSLQGKLEELTAYYQSPDWMQDFEDERAGRFPKDLKRGILTEDAIYDLLTSCDSFQSLVEDKDRYS